MFNTISLTKLNHKIDVYNDETINKICLDVEENDLSCSESKEKLLEWSLATVEDLAHQVSTMGTTTAKTNAA